MALEAVIWLGLTVGAYGYLCLRLFFPFCSTRRHRVFSIVATVALGFSTPAMFGLRFAFGLTPAIRGLQWVVYILFGLTCIAISLLLVRDLALVLIALATRLKPGSETPSPLSTHGEGPGAGSEGSGVGSGVPGAISTGAESARNGIGRRQLITRATNYGVLGLAALTGGKGVHSARKRAATKHVTIPISNLPTDLEGFTIAQLSDIHVGDTIGKNYLQRVVDHTNTLGADVIFVTGDLVDGFVHELSDDVSPIAELSARHGVWFITGNHEYYSGPKEWVEHLPSLGLKVLVNKHDTIQVGDATILVAGVADHDAEHLVPEHRCDPDAAVEGAPIADLRILLAHQPLSYTRARHLNFDLQLSGHTHGGQIWPFGLAVPLQQRFNAGLYRRGQGWVYISKGTGYWGPPMRVAAPSEITRIVLTRA